MRETKPPLTEAGGGPADPAAPEGKSARRRGKPRTGAQTSPAPSAPPAAAPARDAPKGPTLRLDPAAATLAGRRRQSPTQERVEPRLIGPGADRPRPDTRKEGEADAPAPRVNRLMPTNAVHPTVRRMTRRLRRRREAALLLAVVGLVILILAGAEEEAPPEPMITASDPALGARAVNLHRQIASTSPDAGDAPEPSLSKESLAELERLLARLQLMPLAADGVPDPRTESAIRLYQQIAGLPVDGEASPDLLEDLREVVRFLDRPD